MTAPGGPAEGKPDHAPRSVAAAGRRILTAVALAIVVAAALAGYDQWRKRHPGSAEEDSSRTLPAGAPAEEPATERSGAAPRGDLALDLGEGVKMEFVWIKPLDIWVGKYEVTNQEYRRCDPNHRCGEYDNHSLDGDRQPVVKVNCSTDVMGYIEWINARCAEQLPAGHRVRLLSEEESLAILQCGDDREYPWGSGWPPPQDWNYHGEESAAPRPRMADHRDKWPVSCPVEESGRNDWGLYGVADNVQEWNGKARGEVLKRRTHDLVGASWYYGDKDYLRCNCRPSLRYGGSTTYVGFRLVIGP